MPVKTYEQKSLNPVNLESEAGLNRGDIISITIFPDGAVDVVTRDGIDLSKDAALDDKVTQALTKRNLPRGKKPHLSQ